MVPASAVQMSATAVGDADVELCRPAPMLSLQLRCMPGFAWVKSWAVVSHLEGTTFESAFMQLGTHSLYWQWQHCKAAGCTASAGYCLAAIDLSPSFCSASRVMADLVPAGPQPDFE